MAADLKRQPDPFGANADAFGAAMAKRYGVARAEDLPVSLEGLRLEESERLGDAVFDRHYGELARTYAAQRGTLRIVAPLSPLVPLQNLSMALAGTDMAHQLDFQDAAEAQRRRLILALNRDMTLHGKGEDFDYRADPALWKRTEAFGWTPPALGVVLRQALPDLLLLLAWLGVAVALLRLAAARLVRGGV